MLQKFSQHLRKSTLPWRCKFAQIRTHFSGGLQICRKFAGLICSCEFRRPNSRNTTDDVRQSGRGHSNSLSSSYNSGLGLDRTDLGLVNVYFEGQVRDQENDMAEASADLQPIIGPI